MPARWFRMRRIRLPSSVRIGQVPVTCKSGAEEPFSIFSHPVDAVTCRAAIIVVHFTLLERIEDGHRRLGHSSAPRHVANTCREACLKVVFGLALVTVEAIRRWRSVRRSLV